jgi:hypothetical protein
MRARSLLAWIAVGLVGLALAAGVTYAATQLSSQRIGLSAEPPSAGEELAPPARRTTTAPRTTPTVPSRTTVPGGSSRPGEPTDDSRGSNPAPSEERGEGGRVGGTGTTGGGGDLDD